MLIRTRPGWELPEREATPEAVYVNRRQIIRSGVALAGFAALAACGQQEEPTPDSDAGETPAASSTPAVSERAALTAPRNPAYTLDRELTPEDVNIAYNNFYEFGSHKRIANAAERELKPRPWEIRIGGLVEEEKVLDVDALMAAMTLEERLYRHRCVEAWSMTVPWVGFPVRKLVEFARPLGSAKYLKMTTFGDPEMASGIASQSWYPWPYVESITMDEAMNDLPFLVVGAYGKVVANSMGAPIRLHLPWKYGFKSVKSIVSFEFIEERPVGFWETISNQSQSEEYGFWANVNPEVPHPRWSQAQERVLHTGEVVPTLLYNGYGEQVAGLYAGIEGEQLFR